MKTRTVILIISVVLGFLAVAGIFSYIKALQTNIEKEAEKVEVIVAKENLKKNSFAKELFEQGLLEKREIPKKYVAEGALRDFSAIEGKVLTVDVSKGQQITNSILSTTVTAGIAFQVPKGFRAIAIEVNDITGVSGKIRSGDWVDVIASFKQGAVAGAEAKTKIILQKVMVVEGFPEETGFAKTGGVFDENRKTDTPVRRTIILALSPVDVEKLVFAAENGKVWLTLRPSMEEKPVATPGQTINSILR